MATVSKRKNKFVVQVRKGGVKKSRSFDSELEAQKWGLLQDAMIEERMKEPESGCYTLSEAIHRYREVMPPQCIRDRNAHLVSWEAKLGELRLKDITSAKVAEVRDQLLNSPSPNRERLSPGTVNRHLTTLGHLYNMAIREWEWARDNPVSRVRKAKEPRGRTRLLSPEERAALLHSCERIGTDLHLLVILALATGARASELLGLTWQDVNLGDNASLTFRDTKNGETRSVPLVGEALAKLHLWGKVRRVDSQLVLPSYDNPFKPIAYHSRFKRACRLAKLHSFRFHDLRHAAASYLVMSGASLREVAEILGHKTMSMVMRYSHLSTEHLRGTMERMITSL